MFDIYLRATPQQVRSVITEPAMIPSWLAGMRFSPDAREGEPDGPLLKMITPGWPMILSSLKSLMETGEPLEFRGGALPVGPCFTARR